MGGHLAAVGLMVEAGEVEQAVKYQDTELVSERMAVLRSLAGGGFERDGEVAGVLCGRFRAGRES